LTGKPWRRDHGHKASRKESKIRMRITMRKRIQSTIKSQSRTSCLCLDL
jgi:hypothetical protein